MKENIITITTEDGKEIDCQILFTYHSEDFMHDYVVFKDPKSNTAGAAIYIPEGDGKGRLSDIENDEEWEMLQDALDDWIEKHQSELPSCDGDCSCDGGCDSCGCDK